MLGEPIDEIRCCHLRVSTLTPSRLNLLGPEKDVVVGLFIIADSSRPFRVLRSVGDEVSAQSPTPKKGRPFIMCSLGLPGPYTATTLRYCSPCASHGKNK